MENTIKQNMFAMKDELMKTLKGFQDQLEEKKALHKELSEKASRLTDGVFNTDVYAEYTNIGIEKYQLELDMEIINYQIESTEIYIKQTDKIIEKL